MVRLTVIIALAVCGAGLAVFLVPIADTALPLITTDEQALHLLTNDDPYVTQVLRDIYQLHRQRGSGVMAAYTNTLEALLQAGQPRPMPRYPPSTHKKYL